MSLVKKYAYCYPIWFSVALYLLFSLFSVLLDLLRQIDIFNVNFWFIIKLAVLCILSIWFMQYLCCTLNIAERKSKWVVILASVFIVYIITKVLMVVFLLCNQTNDNLSLYKIVFNFLWAIGIGVSEEVLFRGIILTVLLKGYYRTHKSIAFTVLFSNLLFSFGHISNLFNGDSVSSVFVQTAFSFIIGAYFTLIYIYSRSILLSVILHSVYDFVGFIINDISFNELPYFSSLYFVVNVLFVVIIALIVIVNILQFKKTILVQNQSITE